MYKHIPVFARFQWLNDRTVVHILGKFLKTPTRGRKGYNKAWLFRFILYKQLMGCSYRDLESMSGVDYSTFIKFRQRLIARGWFPRAFALLSQPIARALPAITALLDSSFVETYSRYSEAGSGYSGHKEANGFKLHQLIDHATRLPLLQLVSPGNMHDVRGARHLVGRAPPEWHIRAFAADKGYDSEEFVMQLKEKWRRIAVAIPVRKMRQTGDPTFNRTQKKKDRSYDRSLYAKRTEIERYFSRKKRVFRLGEERTRGLANFEANCFLTSIAELLEWVAKVRQLFTMLQQSSP